MSNWVCYECGGTDVWELAWVRTNRISWMLDYEEDVLGYSDAWTKPSARCLDCDKKVFLTKGDVDNA